METICFSEPENGEYMIKLTKYDFIYHAHAKIGEYASFLEGKVRTSEEKYRSLMANARDGIVILDRDGQVVGAGGTAPAT